MPASLEQFQTEAIADYLDACPVSEHGLVGLWGDDLFSLSKKIRAKAPWGELLTDFDAIDLVIRRLFRLNVPSGYVGLLKDAPNGAALVTKALDDIVRYLESLPRNYYAYFPLVSVPTIGQAKLPINDDIAIIDTSCIGALASTLDDTLSLASAMDLEVVSPALEKDMRYVRIGASGYATASLTTDVAASTLAQLKHFVFVSLARSVLKEERTWGMPQQSPPAIIAHAEAKEKERYGLALPEELGHFLMRLQPDLGMLRYFDMSKGKTLLGCEERPPKTPAELAEAMRCKYGRTGEILAIPRENPDLVRIKAAIEWFIDGRTSENQTIAFLQVCIGLEALLGERREGRRPNERGITERLSDRYAYLIGRTQSERDACRREFEKVYELRGDLVHQRETHLRRHQDADACRQAKDMLFNAIAEELNSFMRVTRKSL